MQPLYTTYNDFANDDRRDKSYLRSMLPIFTRSITGSIPTRYRVFPSGFRGKNKPLYEANTERSLLWTKLSLKLLLTVIRFPVYFTPKNRSWKPFKQSSMTVLDIITPRCKMPTQRLAPNKESVFIRGKNKPLYETPNERITSCLKPQSFQPQLSEPPLVDTLLTSFVRMLNSGRRSRRSVPLLRRSPYNKLKRVQHRRTNPRFTQSLYLNKV